MKIKIFVVLTALLCSVNFVYAQPADVPGFMDTRWGMSEQEILDSMKDKVVKLKGKKNFQFGGYATVGMKEIEIDSSKYTVHFLMNRQTDLLYAVNLDIIYRHISDSKEYYESLKKALSKEYGPPSIEGERESKSTKILRAVWMFPSTIILYTEWSSKLNKVMLQFLVNDGKKSLEELGLVEKTK